jgi:hypothetical protein
MEDIGTFFDHLVYFTAIGFILWSYLVIIFGLLIYFPRFGMLYQEKSGNPATHPFPRRPQLSNPVTVTRFWPQALHHDGRVVPAFRLDHFEIFSCT